MMNPDPNGGFRVLYRGGPLDGLRDTFPRRPSNIGVVDAAGVYLQTEELVDGWRVFQWVEVEQDVDIEAIGQGSSGA